MELGLWGEHQGGRNEGVDDLKLFRGLRGQLYINPGRLTWFTYTSPMERRENDLNQSSMIMFHVNLLGSKCCYRWFQMFFTFTLKLGEMIQFDEYFSNGLKPPTS